MDFRSLVADLPKRRSAIYMLERGAPVCHPHAGLFDDVARAEAALKSWGVQAGTRVGIYAPNSYEWLVHDLALIEIGAVSVPFTDDFAGQINKALLDRYNIALLLTARGHARLFPDRPAYVAFLDAPNTDVQVLERTPSGDADEADQLSLVFSSGSAGGLKGLVISRSGVEATLPPIVKAIGAEPKDRLLLFLPMSNFQQRNMCYAALWSDFDIIITDYTRLFEAMKTLDPTILIGPPVLYQMIHADFEKLPETVRRRRLRLGAALSMLPSAKLRLKLARRWFPQLHDQFGKRMRILVTGMAPIRHNIAHFFRHMQLPLCESYGMVEAGSLTFRPALSRKFGSVGRPVEGVRLSFTDDGEIVVHREKPMTLRYFQCAEGENERTFVGDKMIATGDIGVIDQDGDLFLKGRKKELIITAGGYKVHPETIEQELNACPEVAHSVIFLRKDASHLTCVVDLALPGDDDARARVRKFTDSLKSTRRAAQYVELVFAEAPFTRENGMLRPNLKIDRKAIGARYGI